MLGGGETKIEAFVHQLHRNAKLRKAILATFMGLIPKEKNPQALNEYRPISLTGYLYKILSKLLVGILKKVLGKVISLCQNAFQQGR